MVRLCFVTACLLVLGACQTTPETAELMDENQQLQQSLEQAREQIQGLEFRQQQLESEVQELERLSQVLTVEKSSRVQESSELKQQARQFIQQQIEDLKRFLVAGNLLDYVGSERVERNHLESEPATLVDLQHPLPRAGSLTGFSGYFSAPTTVQLKVLRALNDRYLVIWESQPLAVPNAGEINVQLPVTVGVEPGDVIAYVFPEAVNVTFDRGTGDTRLTRKDLPLGEAIKASSLSGEQEGRAYSLGVYAILE